MLIKLTSLGMENVVWRFECYQCCFCREKESHSISFYIEQSELHNEMRGN